ncbi:MAG: hypothetical protein HYV63_09275 [Candidatus Schekmanbacteria bacterium]|nr:hypothetical protein [Candidatus Schekmanbacteria bacterium]
MSKRIVLACLASVLLTASRTGAQEEPAWLSVGDARFCIDDWQVCDLMEEMPSAGNTFTCGYLPPRLVIAGPKPPVSFIAGDRIDIRGTWEALGRKEVSPADIPGSYAGQVTWSVEKGHTKTLILQRAPAPSPQSLSWSLDSSNLEPGYYRLRAALPKEVAARDPYSHEGPIVDLWIEPAGTEEADLERLSRRVHAAMWKANRMGAPDAPMWLRRVVEAGEELIAATPYSYFDAAILSRAYRELGDLTSAQRVARYAWQSVLATPYCRGEANLPHVSYVVAEAFEEAFGSYPPDWHEALLAREQPYAKGGLPCGIEELVCERQRRDFPGKRIEHWFCLPDQQRPARFQDWVSGENPWKLAPGQP